MHYMPIPISVLVLAACGGGGAAVPAPSGSAPAEATPISEIQGSGASSPMDGQTVSVSGIVTGDFQDNDADADSDLGGFYVQQETPDNNAATSEGVFIFDGSNPATDVGVGDRVAVAGTVAEFFGETQITAAEVTVIGNGLTQTTDINLPASGTTLSGDGDSVADLERYEGMLVRFPQQLSVTNLRFLEQFGEVGLSEGGRLFQFTNSNAPSVAAYQAHKDSIAARSIVLDDGTRSSNRSPPRFLNAGVAPDFSIRVGATTAGITGNLRYSRGSGGRGDERWRLMPTSSLSFVDANPRPGAPDVSGALRVASFNVLNFFSTADSGRPACGPLGDDDCRGADSSAELSRQIAKTVSALVLMDADIVGLIELENNTSASISTIVSALNARLGSNDYAFLDTGSIGDDAIKTGFVYRTSRVQLTGPFAVLSSSVDPEFNDARNRPALAQSFEVNASGAILTVIVNHLKSKGSSCATDGDTNLGDGQGNCNMTRTNAATAITAWLATDPTGSNDDDFLIIGDLNAYAAEDPLTALTNAGMVSLLDTDPYSFIFDGQSGALDHAIASSSLAPQVAEIIEWHVNADEPALLDYNLENGRDANLFDPDSPYRASDHDPVIVGLDLTN